MRTMIHMQTTHYASNGQELRPGLAIDVPTNDRAIEFRLKAICDAVPDQWHGEVRFGSEVLLRTEAVASENAAGHRAEAMLRERIVQVFGRASRSDDSK